MQMPFPPIHGNTFLGEMLPRWSIRVVYKKLWCNSTFSCRAGVAHSGIALVWSYVICTCMRACVLVFAGEWNEEGERENACSSVSERGREKESMRAIVRTSVLVLASQRLSDHRHTPSASRTGFLVCAASKVCQLSLCSRSQSITRNTAPAPRPHNTSTTVYHQRHPLRQSSSQPFINFHHPLAKNTCINMPAVTSKSQDEINAKIDDLNMRLAAVSKRISRSSRLVDHMRVGNLVQNILELVTESQKSTEAPPTDEEKMRIQWQTRRRVFRKHLEWTKGVSADRKRRCGFVVLQTQQCGLIQYGIISDLFRWILYIYIRCIYIWIQNLQKPIR